MEFTRVFGTQNDSLNISEGYSRQKSNPCIIVTKTEKYFGYLVAGFLDVFISKTPVSSYIFPATIIRDSN